LIDGNSGTRFAERRRSSGRAGPPKARRFSCCGAGLVVAILRRCDGLALSWTVTARVVRPARRTVAALRVTRQVSRLDDRPQRSASTNYCAYRLSLARRVNGAVSRSPSARRNCAHTW
jgi:hypothetical protein